MIGSRSLLLRTTTVQAFARTVADPSRRTRQVGPPRGIHDDTLASGPVTEVTPAPFSDAALPDVGDVVGGHYKLVRLLGQGMFGKVYVAQRLDVPEHQVALKILPRSLYASRNVERELVMLATVGHPHVVQLKDHGTTPDYVWLTMPVYEGETLAERLEKKGTLSPRQAYDIFLPMARGLEALHAAGLRHQDVKPENVFLAVFGGRVHPILLDLGVAAEKDASFVAGTALYGAPEQVAALSGLPVIHPLTEKMDTYGLAATLLMALVGPKHFPGERATDRDELARAQEERTRDPISLGALPEVYGEPRAELEACFRRWLAFLPEDRPTMRQMAEQLEVLLEPDAEEVRREERRRARQERTILRFKLAVAGMLLVGVAGGAVAYNQRETLRIAADLDTAQREGARSFDELGTCNAAHASDTRALGECRAGAERAASEHRQELEDVMRSGSTSQQEHAREVARYNARLKTCEDNAATQKRTDDAELTRVMMESAHDKAALAADRDEARRQVEASKAEAAMIGAERDQCKAERATCVEERDTLKAAAAARPPAPPSSGGQGSPAAPHEGPSRPPGHATPGGSASAALPGSGEEAPPAPPGGHRPRGSADSPPASGGSAPPTAREAPPAAPVDRKGHAAPPPAPHRPPPKPAPADAQG